MITARPPVLARGPLSVVRREPDALDPASLWAAAVATVDARRLIKLVIVDLFDNKVIVKIIIENGHTLSPLRKCLYQSSNAR